MRGIVDSSDLPLNVSREIFKNDRQIVVIRRAIVSKILRHFANMMKNDREAYEKFGQLWLYS